MAKYLALAIDFKKFTPNIVDTGKFLTNSVYKGSSLILFHIIEYLLTPPAYLLPYLNVEKERIEKELKSIIETLQKEGYDAQEKILLGEFWTALDHFVDTYRPELIVLGYEPHFLKVPTAEKILERFDWNYLVVKGKPLVQLKRILCPFDFSESSFKALRLSAQFAKETSAELVILHVISPPDLADKTARLRFISEKEREIKEEWETIPKEDLLAGIESRFEITFGDRVELILNEISSNEIDLIVMGKRGKILKSGIGWLTKAIIKSASIPVLLATS